MFDALLDELESELRAALSTAVTGLVATARTRLEEAVAEVAEERAKGLAEIAQERADLHREIKAMQTHQVQQEGCVELNIGGYRFQTSVKTLRRVPHTFFDAYFSGRYAQDVCYDGSIFVDRDGEHFGHVLEYMRDGIVSVAEPGALPSVNLLRSLKREFGFYCIELCAEEPVPNRPSEVAFVMGGIEHDGRVLSSIERYNAFSGEWSAMAGMSTARQNFGACVLDGEFYVIAGFGSNEMMVDSVEKFSLASDAWIALAPLPAGRVCHATVVVGSVVHIMGGETEDGVTASALKFDSAQGSWSEVAPMPAPRGGIASCTYMNDIYVFGGYDEDGEDQASVFKFDTEAGEWTTQAPMPSVCALHSASLIDGQVYIVGAGNSGHDVLRFDFATSAWSTLARTIHHRDRGNSFMLAGRLYVAGGGSAPSASMERYDVATNSWTVVADMLEGRNHFCAVCIESASPTEEQDLFDSLITKALTQRA
jgi:N-acetylneuraminic acid mutarotase